MTSTCSGSVLKIKEFVHLLLSMCINYYNRNDKCVVGVMHRVRLQDRQQRYLGRAVLPVMLLYHIEGVASLMLLLHELESAKVAILVTKSRIFHVPATTRWKRREEASSRLLLRRRWACNQLLRRVLDRSLVPL